MTRRCCKLIMKLFYAREKFLLNRKKQKRKSFPRPSKVFSVVGGDGERMWIQLEYLWSELLIYLFLRESFRGWRFFIDSALLHVLSLGRLRQGCFSITYVWMERVIPAAPLISLAHSAKQNGQRMTLMFSSSSTFTSHFLSYASPSTSSS